jgi:hypothetical protein
MGNSFGQEVELAAVEQNSYAIVAESSKTASLRFDRFVMVQRDVEFRRAGIR